MRDLKFPITFYKNIVVFRFLFSFFQLVWCILKQLLTFSSVTNSKISGVYKFQSCASEYLQHLESDNSFIKFQLDLLTVQVSCRRMKSQPFTLQVFRFIITKTTIMLILDK